MFGGLVMSKIQPMRVKELKEIAGGSESYGPDEVTEMAKELLSVRKVNNRLLKENAKLREELEQLKTDRNLKKREDGQ